MTTLKEKFSKINTGIICSFITEHEKEELDKEYLKKVEEWLQQKKRYQQEVGYETSYQSIKRYCTNQIISKFIAEIEKELEEENKK